MTVNIFADEWDGERANPGHQWRFRALGRVLGAEALGACLYEVAPGQRMWPYHYHYANEELAIVLEGRPTLRTEDGEQELEPWSAVLFPRGPEHARQIRNGTDEPVRVLVISTMLHPEVAGYPDTGKVNVIAGGRPEVGADAEVELMFRRDDAIGYFEGEPGAD
jgi:uncharacterized cupin superfamily protein